MIRMGEWHANEAVRLRPNEDIPGSIMMFYSLWQKLKDLCSGTMQCEDMWKAAEKRREMMKNDEKLNINQEARPWRYQCAALGCKVQADRGAFRSVCSIISFVPILLLSLSKIYSGAGRCDEDFKPSYCSKEYQKKFDNRPP